MFNFDEDPIPRRWGDMSFDYRLMFGLHGLAMAMFIAGQSLTTLGELAVLGGGWVAAAALSIANRARLGWRWPGAGPKQWLRAAIYLLPFAIMAFVSAQGLAFDGRIALPWYFALSNLAVFWTLSNLRITRMSKSRFEADLQGLALEPATKKPGLPGWKQRVRVAYYIAFVAVWLAGMASFYVDERQMNLGSARPTVLQSHPLTDHGRTVYLAAQDAALVSWLGTASAIGIPIVLLSGFALQFLFGVPLFDNRRTRWTGWKRNA